MTVLEKGSFLSHIPNAVYSSTCSIMETELRWLLFLGCHNRNPMRQRFHSVALCGLFTQTQSF